MRFSVLGFRRVLRIELQAPVVIPSANFVCGGYTVFTLSVRASVRPSVCPSVTFCFLNIWKSSLDFHQTLQTCSCMQDKYFNQKSNCFGPILLELFLFVVLNGFLYRVLCLCYYSPYTGQSTPTTAFDGTI